MRWVALSLMLLSATPAGALAITDGWSYETEGKYAVLTWGTQHKTTWRPRFPFSRILMLSCNKETGEILLTRRVSRLQRDHKPEYTEDFAERMDGREVSLTLSVRGNAIHLVGRAEWDKFTPKLDLDFVVKDRRLIADMTRAREFTIDVAGARENVSIDDLDAKDFAAFQEECR